MVQGRSIRNAADSTKFRKCKNLSRTHKLPVGKVIFSALQRVILLRSDIRLTTSDIALCAVKVLI